MSNSKRKKVFMALSGGVDSSVAAALLMEEGYEVIGCHIKCYNIDGCGEKDAEDARRAAEQLGAPFYVFDLEKEYKEKVVRYMVDGYKNGLTPNPDIMCNKEIKFGLFLKRALELGVDFVATGHYIKIQSASRRIKLKTQNDNLKSKIVYKLYQAKDANKDQSYFLWTLTQQQLKHCLFPLGDYTKKQVRVLAKKFSLLTAEKKDSQGICFLGKITLADFLNKYIPAEKGVVLSVAGEKIGEHKGAQFYTVGQRHGFQIQSASRRIKLKKCKPCYIAEKNTADNTLTIVEGSDNPALYREEVELSDVNFVSPKFKTGNYKLKIPVRARVRYRQPFAEANLLKLNTKNYKLVFESPQKFIAPGQSAVFYSRAGELLGGGIIAT